MLDRQLLMFVTLFAAGIAGATTVDTTKYYPTQAGNQWSYINQNGQTLTTTIGSPVTLPSGVTAVPANSVNTAEPGITTTYFTNDGNGFRRHQESESSVYVQNHGYTSYSGTFNPAWTIAPATASIGSTYTSSGTVRLVYTNVLTTTMSYSASTQIVGFETIADSQGTKTWSALKVITSITVSGTVNGQYLSTTSSSTVWLAEGVGPVRSMSPNAAGVLETWKLTSTNVTSSVTPPDNLASVNFQGLWWNASESGWGINLNHQGDIIFATWFTYDAQGKPWWLIATLNKAATGVYSGAVYTVAGLPFGTVPWDASRVTSTPVGVVTVTFSTADAGSLFYTVNGITQTKAITKQVFGPAAPVCTM